MGSNMRRLFPVLALALCLLSGPAQAQETPTLASLEISLWPEFDRPELLVIYQGLFAADTPLPVAVELRIPASAGQPTAVAYVDEAGQRLNQQYTTRLEGDWLVLSFELATLGFQVEYYAALAVDAAGLREVAYTYAADHPTNALNLNVQVPPGAQAFALDPAADRVTQEADGLTYHLVSAGSVAQGDSRSWTITYEKTGSALTVESLAPAEVPAEVPPAPAEEGDGSSVVIFVIAFVALIAVGGAAFWLGRQTHPAPEPPHQPSRRSKRRGSKPFKEETFCHQCGARLRYDSEFCHKCGTVVRESTNTR
jgi:hypothetical protein